MFQVASLLKGSVFTPFLNSRSDRSSSESTAREAEMREKRRRSESGERVLILNTMCVDLED